MKPRKITYVVFVTTTLLSAILLFTAIHLTDPLVLKYRATISEICSSHAQLESESDVLAAFPKLSLAKDKLSALKAIRCQLQRIEASPVSSDEVQRSSQMSHCKQSAQLLVQEITQLIQEVEKTRKLAYNP